MPRTRTGPPSRLRDAGQAKWFERHNITCDFCRQQATIRWRKHNVCDLHLNQPYNRVKLGDGTPYLEEVHTMTTSSKSSLTGF